MLVSRGLARSFGEDAAPPRATVAALRSKYDKLEEKARRDQLGAWGEAASTPTIALPDASKKSDEDHGVGSPVDTSDIMQSALDGMGIGSE
jgi:endonuclease YncB( thermonuclease family)